MQRHVLEDGTVLTVQRPADACAAGKSLAFVFDGRPMIDAGIPEMVRSLQEEQIIGPLTTIYVESIQGSTIRGPRRVASLTDPVLLESLVQTLQRFLQLSEVVTAEPERRVVMGHSLGGNAALHVASRWPGLVSRVATGSAALWWPGDEVQLSGSQVAAEVQTVSGLRLWMTAGAADDPTLLRSNREFWKAADEAGLDLVHEEHPGGHELSAWRMGLSRALPHLLKDTS
jgi:enterochelin esterase-like enzyme